jgi:hypothetical protein
MSSPRFPSGLTDTSYETVAVRPAASVPDTLNRPSTISETLSAASVLTGSDARVASSSTAAITSSTSTGPAAVPVFRSVSR